jgi:hypothetical protein
MAAHRNCLATDMFIYRLQFNTVTRRLPKRLISEQRNFPEELCAAGSSEPPAKTLVFCRIQVISLEPVRLA